jgi:putative ABC transport system substrate-binding protein
MRRREFISFLGGAAAAWPLAARAQSSGGPKRIGVLMPFAESDPSAQARVAALRQGLQKAGWIEGRNARLEVRWASADLERMRIDAAELADWAPDIIVTGSNVMTTIVSRQFHDVPIVFGSASDPLESGLISSMAHPAGNVTGFILFESAMSGKWVELIKEIAPSVTRVAVLNTPATPATPGYMRVLEAAASKLGLAVTSAPVRTLADIGPAIEAFARDPNGGLVVLSTPILGVYREQIIALAARHRVPAVYPASVFVVDGGLMSYAPEPTDPYRRAASYVDRILRGEKPGDLPVEFPTKFELVVNLNTAKGLGLTIPESFLLRADEVIE